MLQELMERVSPEWRNELIQFVKTGEASKAFYAAFEKDEHMQAVVDYEFTRIAKQFRELGDMLREDRERRSRD